MSNKPSSTLIGAFIIGAVAIVVTSLVFFSGGDFFRKKSLFVIHFDRSIQGLEPGAALKLRGVKIGEVTRIESRFYEETMSVINSVYVQVVDGETGLVGGEPNERIEELVSKHGLRAQLKLQSYLTGLLFIEVDFTGRNRDMKLWNLDPDVFELPATTSEIERLTGLANEIDFHVIVGRVENIVANVDRFLADPEFHAIAGNVNATLTSFNTLATDADRVIVGELVPALDELKRLVRAINADYPSLAQGLEQSLTSLERSFLETESAIRSASHLISDDSPLLFEFRQTLAKISGAADTVSTLAESLEREPEALIRGKSR